MHIYLHIIYLLCLWLYFVFVSVYMYSCMCYMIACVSMYMSIERSSDESAFKWMHICTNLLITKPWLHWLILIKLKVKVLVFLQQMAKATEHIWSFSSLMKGKEILLLYTSIAYKIFYWNILQTLRNWLIRYFINSRKMRGKIDTNRINSQNKKDL